MVVESPAKAAKIQKWLGNSYQVIASFGHIRDLPSKAGAVQPSLDFEMTWELTSSGAAKYKAIEVAVRSASRVIFATDPDREGEAISWHVAQELQGAGLLAERQVERVTFTDITHAAVLRALAQPRQVSQALVEACLARRALDYLVGFTLSPLLWKKLPGARSAGRVQSVALRIVCEREQEIAAFRSEEYWSVEAVVELPGGSLVDAQLVEVDRRMLRKMDIRSGQEAAGLTARVQAAQLQVLEVVAKATSRTPPPPFTTSSLQQEAARRLGFSVQHTMSIAQQLYEGTQHSEGLISYMRTDSTQLSSDAVEEARAAARAAFGGTAVPREPRLYKSPAKNSQEAHEAIRPTNPGLHPSALPAGLSPDEKSLYALIWSRTMACQMANARLQQVSVVIGPADRTLALRAATTHVEDPGFLQAYDDLSEAGGGARRQATDEESEDEAGDAEQGQRPDSRRRPPLKLSAETILALKAGQRVGLQEVGPLRHETRPPGRYSEAGLVKAMEAAGIGRPSTYAYTISLLQKRKYIVREGRALIPTSIGLDLVTFLVHFFALYVDYAFTSDLEARLDDVAGGRQPWRALLDGFWRDFSHTCDAVEGVSIRDVYDLLDQELEAFEFPTPESRRCPACGTGRLQRKPSKHGSFIGCSNFDHPQQPCSYTQPLRMTTGGEVTSGEAESVQDGSAADVMLPQSLGPHPVTGQEVSVRQGPYGPYVQLEPAPDGATTKRRAGGKKQQSPARVALPPGLVPSHLTLADAAALLALPRQLGTHPDDALAVTLATGRYGLYVQHSSVLASVPAGLLPSEVTLGVALELLQKKAQQRGGARRGRRRGGATTAVADVSADGDGSEPSPEPATATRRRRGTAASADAAVRATSTESRKDELGTPPRAKALRAPTAYNLFIKARRPHMQAQYPEASSAQLMKLLATQWGQLSDEEKRMYKPDAFRLT